jgi:hypothetical protein
MEIRNMIKVDFGLDALMVKGLWDLMERYDDVFAWHKGKLGCCVTKDHVINMQGFPPC